MRAKIVFAFPFPLYSSHYPKSLFQNNNETYTPVKMAKMAQQIRKTLSHLLHRVRWEEKNAFGEKRGS